MNFNKAKKLITIDITSLNLEKLQKFKIKILDAWRFVKGDYGYNNDFFVKIGELNNYVPRDYWLLKNLETKLDEIQRREAYLIKKG